MAQSGSTNGATERKLKNSCEEKRLVRDKKVSLLFWLLTVRADQRLCDD